MKVTKNEIKKMIMEELKNILLKESVDYDSRLEPKYKRYTDDEIEELFRGMKTINDVYVEFEEHNDGVPSNTKNYIKKIKDELKKYLIEYLEKYGKDDLYKKASLQSWDIEKLLSHVETRDDENKENLEQKKDYSEIKEWLTDEILGNGLLNLNDYEYMY